MNTNNSNDPLQYESTTAESYAPFIPTTPKTSEATIIGPSHHLQSKPMSTKSMMKQAIKALAQNSRKGFSLAGIRKYIRDNFVHTANDLKHRMPFMKKFFKIALETGDVVSVKGVGLTGSFRVPPTSPLHKNAKKTKRHVEKLKRKPVKKIGRKLKVKPGPSLKPKNVKTVKRTFSAKI